MAYHIITGTFTAQTMQGMTASPAKRAAAVRPLIEATDGKLTTFLVATGASDFLMLVEVETFDHRLLRALLLAAASGGVSNLRTMRADTAADLPQGQRAAGEMIARLALAG